jgi:hypothetical protein
MSHVLYASTIGRLMFVIIFSNVLHAVGVVNGNMTKPGKERGNGCFDLLEA